MLGFAVLLSAPAAGAICNPNLVRILEPGAHPARATQFANVSAKPDIGLAQYSLRWFSHLSFAIRFGAGRVWWPTPTSTSLPSWSEWPWRRTRPWRTR